MDHPKKALSTFYKSCAAMACLIHTLIKKLCCCLCWPQPHKLYSINPPPLVWTPQKNYTFFRHDPSCWAHPTRHVPLCVKSILSLSLWYLQISSFKIITSTTYFNTFRTPFHTKYVSPFAHLLEGYQFLLWSWHVVFLECAHDFIQYLNFDFSKAWNFGIF